MTGMLPEPVASAYLVATGELRACYGPRGIRAGRGKNGFYGARQAFFAARGALCLGDLDVVKSTVDAFLSNQRDDGMLPVYISHSGAAQFGQPVGEPLDHHGIFLELLWLFLRASGQREYLSKRAGAIEKIVSFLESHENATDPLVEEKPFSNWSSTVLKSGQVHYTNCTYWAAHHFASLIFSDLERDVLALRSEKKAAATREAINHRFWFGNYYRDWRDPFGTHDFFSLDGNTAAMAFGIADEGQAQRIQNTVRQHRLDAVPVVTNHPAYPFWCLPPVLLPFEAYHVHNGYAWPWLGAWYAMALSRYGWMREGRQILKRMSELIARDGCVPSFWNPKGKTVRGFLIQSDQPYAWSAGMFVAATHALYPGAIEDHSKPNA